MQLKSIWPTMLLGCLACAEEDYSSRRARSESDSAVGMPAEAKSLLAAPASSRLVGFFRSADCQALQGWAELPSTSGLFSKRTISSLRVQIWTDGLPGQGGTKIAEGAATASLAALPAKARHAFAIATPRELMNGKPRALYAFVSSEELSSPVRLKRWANGKADGEPFNVTCAPPVNINGSLSYVTEEALKGWAHADANHPAKVEIEVWMDGLPGIGTLIAKTTANQTIAELRERRPDLAGRSFEVLIPQTVRDGLDHDVYVVGRYPGAGATYSLLMLYTDGVKSGTKGAWPLQLNRQQVAAATNGGPDRLQPARRQVGDPERRLLDYEYVWGDEFDGLAVDESKWVARPEGGEFSVEKTKGGLQKTVETANRPENLRVKDGQLVVELRKQQATYVKKNVQRTAEYTGGGVISRMRFTEGYYEARVKVPSKAGWHTSFWSLFMDLPELRDRATSTREKLIAYRGDHLELDFMEHTSSQKSIYTNNIHRNVLNGVHLGDYAIVQYGTLVGAEYDTGVPLSDRFHIIGAEVTKTQIRFYFDGNLVDELTLTKDRLGNPMNNNAQNIILSSLAFLRSFDDAVDETPLRPDDPTLLEEARFDWVRIYAKKH